MEHILIIAPNWIGDMLMAQPLLKNLKTSAKKNHITVLAPQWVAPVLRYMPEVDTIIPTQFAHGQLNLYTRWRLAQTLRIQNFNICYVLPNSWKSAILPWLIGIPIRIGYIGEIRYGLLNRYLSNPSKSERPPMILHYTALSQLHISDHLDIQNKPHKDQLDHLITQQQNSILPSHPQLIISSKEITQTASQFNIDPNKPLLVFCPGAEFGSAKRWPITHFSNLAHLIHIYNPDIQIISLGSYKDRVIAQEISGTVRNLCGETCLEQAIALLARANVVVSNDSGLMHISAALARPLIALFGSSDPRHTSPNSNQAISLWLHLSCSPCYQRHCPLNHLRCLYDITPDQVMPFIQKILPLTTITSS